MQSPDDLINDIGFLKKLNDVDKVDLALCTRQLEIEFCQKAAKGKEASDLYRDQGNMRYVKEEFIRTLELFNKSVCFAPEGSNQLCKAYADRSAVYFSLKMYDLCLKNIKMARKNKYPNSLMFRLDDREAKCMNEMENRNEKLKNEFNGLKPKLSYPAHEKLPFIANCLDVTFTRDTGYCVVATTDLKVGDVVAIEKPFCASSMDFIHNICCANCYKENDLDLIPCSNCHFAMFCSPQCLAETKQNFHNIECPIINFLNKKSAEKDVVTIVIRFILMAVEMFESIDELIQFFKMVDEQDDNIFTVDYKRNEKACLLASILKAKNISFSDAD